ncbi:hypothetical protein KFK14_17675 [Sphingobium phenoxybenzoativorans]|uniref:Uncharacterized protein n=1 Tax=Sphingobium phenoxybenzoativorans TaxID=1592790 RepID=A0A975Q0Y1_9SPHN|nr:hypothetical protein [Sphingobium phenoxybenzoativorans]QUT04843.1 hypothetical protein KFK14_17675 [Sphingobium phenoxybenzoativorans]
MTIKIGDKTFTVKKPSDIDGALIASMGLNAAEVVRLLQANPLAHHVAGALAPYLGDDAPAIADLSRAIAEHGLTEVAVAVAQLLKVDPAPTPPLA